MRVSERLRQGQLYSRKELANAFGITDATLNTGIFQPEGRDSIWLCVTKHKQADRTQYHDDLVGDDLSWESQTTGRKDERIINHERLGLQLLIFYRPKKDSYPNYAFRYEGAFRYVSHEATHPARFHFHRLKSSLLSPTAQLEVVGFESQVRSNISRFHNDLPAYKELARKLARQVIYWVYDADEDTFAPAKFVGFQDMSFGKYNAGLAGTSEGDKFDGHLTHETIEGVLNRRNQPSGLLSKRLSDWGRNVLGVDVFENVETAKWRFIQLPSSRNYWALVCKPSVYDIDAALQTVETDTWTVKRSDVKKGDRAVLWRGVKDGKRGVVAFGEVLTDPQVMDALPETHPFFLGGESPKKERRVLARLFVPPHAPLWLDDDKLGVLRTLTVAKAHGGTIFHIAPEQWHPLVEALGGWDPQPDVEDALEQLHRASKVVKGQGFRVPRAVREAIEKYSMQWAIKHFEDAGYKVNNVSKNSSFDLQCSRGSEELHVEVKGTQTMGENVLLTPNEVEHARRNAVKMALFVVHSIRVSGDSTSPQLTGGEVRLIRPWNIELGALEPLGFAYSLPPA